MVIRVFQPLGSFLHQINVKPNIIIPPICPDLIIMIFIIIIIIIVISNYDVLKQIVIVSQ